MSTARVFSSERIAIALSIASLVACCCIALLSVDYLPTHDGPQHVYTIHAANHLSDPATGYSRFLAPNTPITSYGFLAFFGPLDLVLPWRPALTASLLAMTLLFVSGCLVLARTLHPARVWLGIALCGATFRWTLYMGLFSFYVATSFGLFVLAYALANRNPNRGRRFILGSLLTLQALFHIFPAVITAGIIGLLGLAEARTGERIRSLLASLLMCAPVALLAGILLFVSPDQSLYHDRSGEDFAMSAPPLFSLARCLTGGPDWRAWPLTLLALSAPVIAFALARRKLEIRDRVLLAIGFALLACGAVLPLHIPVWDFFSVRFLPIAVICLILAIPLERLAQASTRRGVAIGSTLFAIASCGWAIGYNRDLDSSSRSALAGLDAALERSGPRLAIVMDPFLGRPHDNAQADIPYAVPLLNLGQIYATEQGGVPADSFAISPPTHHVLFRTDTGAFPAYPSRGYSIALREADADAKAELRKKITTYVGSYAARFEDVILWGEPADAQLLMARGFVPDWQAGGLLIAHFEGCPLSVEIEPPAATSSGAALESTQEASHRYEPQVELGWFPLLETASAHRAQSDADQFARGDRTSRPSLQRIEVVGAPCGPVWIRVRDAREDPSNPMLASHACRGADAQGRLILADSRRTPLVRCTLVSREVNADASRPAFASHPRN